MNHVPRPQTFLQLEKAQRSLRVGLSLRRKLQSVKKKVENWKQVRLRTQKFASLQLPNKKPFWEVFSPFAKKRAAKEQQTIRVTSTIGEEWNTGLNDEELVTKSTGAEVLLNSRPLTYQSASHEDDVPSTPNHFLIGQDSGQFTPESVEETNYNY